MQTVGFLFESVVDKHIWYKKSDINVRNIIFTILLYLNESLDLWKFS